MQITMFGLRWWLPYPFPTLVPRAVDLARSATKLCQEGSYKGWHLHSPAITCVIASGTGIIPPSASTNHKLNPPPYNTCPCIQTITWLVCTCSQHQNFCSVFRYDHTWNGAYIVTRTLGHCHLEIDRPKIKNENIKEFAVNMLLIKYFYTNNS